MHNGSLFAGRASVAAHRDECVRDRRGAETLIKAIFEPWPGTSGKDITGRFEGTLRYDRDEKRLFPYYLEVEAVENLNIKIGERPW